MRRPNGFSLVELLIVVVIIGIIVSVGLPRFRATQLQSDVRSARTAVIQAYLQARAAAVGSGRTTRLRSNGTSVWITGSPRLMPAAGSTMDTVGQITNLFQRYGVAGSASPGTTVTIDPRGFNTSGTVQFRVTKSGRTDSVVVSGFGQVIK